MSHRHCWHWRYVRDARGAIVQPATLYEACCACFEKRSLRGQKVVA